jgi:hypothetical protein
MVKITRTSVVFKGPIGAACFMVGAFCLLVGALLLKQLV